MNQPMSYEDRKIQTFQALENPQVGDKFTYNYSETIYVAFRHENLVISTTHPANGTWRIQTLKEFKYQFSWPFIELTERGVNVVGWWESEAFMVLAEKIKQLTDRISDLENSVNKLTLKDEGWITN